jgi:hypothetical protein
LYCDREITGAATMLRAVAETVPLRECACQVPDDARDFTRHDQDPTGVDDGAMRG